MALAVNHRDGSCQRNAGHSNHCTIPYSHGKSISLWEVSPESGNLPTPEQNMSILTIRIWAACRVGKYWFRISRSRYLCEHRCVRVRSWRRLILMPANPAEGSAFHLFGVTFWTFFLHSNLLIINDKKVKCVLFIHWQRWINLSILDTRYSIYSFW